MAILKKIKSTIVISLIISFVALPFAPFAGLLSVSAQQKLGPRSEFKGTLLSDQSQGALGQIDQDTKELYHLLRVIERPSLKISKKDMEYIKQGKVDRRVLRALDYLVTPRELGGAGYQHIKVSRIFKGYDSRISQRGISREYPEGTEPNQSVHAKGQAFDISEIDYIRMVVKQHKIIGTKKKQQPRIPLKVAWQTEEGFLKSGGLETYNQTMQGFFSSLGFAGLNEGVALEIADLLGLEIDFSKYPISDLGDLAKTLGIMWTISALDIPELDLSDIDLHDLSIEAILKEAGRSYLSTILDLPKEGVRGKNYRELTQNIGRAEVEARLSIPEGSLQSNNGKSRDILIAVARRRIEEDLNLPRGTMKDVNGNLELIKKALEPYKNSQHQDAVLSLPLSYTPDGKEDPNKAVRELLDPSTDKAKLLEGFGKHYLSELLANNSVDQLLIRRWLEDKSTRIAYNPDYPLTQNLFWKEGDPVPTIHPYWQLSVFDEAKISQDYGLASGDLENIFIDNHANATFERIGRVELLKALGNEAMERYPDNPFVTTYKSISFYASKAKTIKREIDNLQNSQAKNKLKPESDDLNDNDPDPEIEKDIVAQLQDAVAEIKDNPLYSQLTKLDKGRLDKVENAVDSYLTDFDIPFMDDISSSDFKLPGLQSAGLNISGEKLISLLFSDDPDQAVEELALDVVASKWEIEWGLQEGDIKKLIDGEDVSNIAEDKLLDIAEEFFIKEIGLPSGIFGVEDVKNILKGKWDSDSFIKLGGAIVDQAAGLTAGTIAAVIKGEKDPETALKEAGAKRLGEFLGVNLPSYALEGDFVKNMGSSIIETRLGLPERSFKDKDSIEKVLEFLDSKTKGKGFERFVAAFALSDLSGTGVSAIKQAAGLEKNQDALERVDGILGVKKDTTKTFLLGDSAVGAFVKDVGESSAASITTDRILGYLGLDDDLKGTVNDIIKKIIVGETWNTDELLTGFLELAGVDLEAATGFNLDDWKAIFGEPDENGESKKFNDIVTEKGKDLFDSFVADRIGAGGDEKKFTKSFFQEPNAISKNEISSYIANQTGIPSEDINQFLDGDIKEGLISFSAFQMAKFYNQNDIFGIGAISQDTIKAFLTTDSSVLDEKIYEGLEVRGVELPDEGTTALEKLEKLSEIGELSDDEVKQLKREVIDEARKDIAEELQYKMFDAQLKQFDPDIPQGFSQAMFSGDIEARKDMFASYLAPKVAEFSDGFISESIAKAILSGQKVTDDQMYGVVDNAVKKLTGITIKDGTFKLVAEGNGWEALSLNKNLVSKYVDKYLGLPSGTTQLVWNSYEQYTKAAADYANALKEFADNADKLALDNAKQAFRNIKAQIIAQIVTFVFAKQLSKLDQKFGLPAGTSSALLSALLLGFSPAALIGLAYSLLFGVYKVSAKATSCNYWPYNATDASSAPAWMKMRNPDHEDELGILPPEFPYCPGVWNAKDSSKFQTNAVAAAQYKVAMLVGDLLYMGKRLAKQGEEIATGDNMYPVQILTQREEDRTRYENLIVSHYGKLASERGWTGVIISEKVWDHVHVGY